MNTTANETTELKTALNTAFNTVDLSALAEFAHRCADRAQRYVNLAAYYVSDEAARLAELAVTEATTHALTASNCLGDAGDALAVGLLLESVEMASESAISAATHGGCSRQYEEAHQLSDVLALIAANR